MVEIEGRWGGYVGQIDQSVVMGALPAWAREGHQTAVESFWDVVAAMRPGVTLGELRQAARENCVFLVKPITTYRGQRDTGHVGETVVVTATGAERLGTRPIDAFWHVW